VRSAAKISPRRQRSTFGPLLVEFDNRVLAPRPWTFLQSQWAVELAAEVEPGTILELCAGAGHIGLAAAVLSERHVVQVEADPVAADYAVRNAARAGWAARVDVRVAQLDEAIAPHERFPLVIADPPYLRTADVRRWPNDPVTAIDGGPDGLHVMTRCLEVSSRCMTDDGRLLLQTAGPKQSEAVDALLHSRPGLDLRIDAMRVHDDERSVLLLVRR
jgi:methylase of polypeptide subunit release factors